LLVVTYHKMTKYKNEEAINSPDTQCQVKLCLRQIIVILLSKYIYRKVHYGLSSKQFRFNRST
jgi:hypothetical protein